MSQKETDLTPAELDLFSSQFKKEVTDRSNEIDPAQEEDWHSLTLGWAIAKGMSAENARAFATFIRYDTQLG